MNSKTTSSKTTTKRRNTFSKMGGSVYTCDCCGRRTRHTGAQSLGSTLCPQCYDLAGIENEISDGYTTLADAREQIDALLAEIRAKGGNPDESFSALLAVDAAPVDTHEHAPCALCGVDCSTHDDAANPLASCGDCGAATCPDHRVADAATRCVDCAAKFYATPAPVVVEHPALAHIRSCDACQQLRPCMRLVAVAAAMSDAIDTCPGCGCRGGEGRTPGCVHPDGCGHDAR